MMKKETADSREEARKFTVRGFKDEKVITMYRKASIENCA